MSSDDERRSITPSEIKNYLVRGTISNYALRFLSFGMWFVLTPVIIHHLGTTLYGLWLIVASITAYGTLFDFIGPTVSKYVAEYNAKNEIEAVSDIIATALCLYVALGVVIVAASVPLGFFVAPNVLHVSGYAREITPYVVILTAIGVAVEFPAAIAGAVLNGMRKVALGNLIGMGAISLLGACTVVVLLLGGGLVAMVALTAPLALMWQLPLVYFAKRSAPGLRYGFRGVNRKVLRKVSAFSVPVVLWNSATAMKNQSDVIVIGAFLPVARVTPYGIARRLSDVPGYLALEVISLVAPLASHLDAREQHAQIREIAVVVTRVTLGVFIPVAALLALLAGPVIKLWLGREYGPAGEIVAILLAASVLDVAIWPMSSVMQGMGKQRMLALLAIGTGLLNITLSIVFVTQFGIIGVAVATLVAIAVQFIIGFPYALRLIGIHAKIALERIVAPIVIPCIPLAGVLVLLSYLLSTSSIFAVIVTAVLGFVVYIGTYLLIPACVVERSTLADLGRGLRLKR